MELYIKQKMLSFKDRFSIYDCWNRGKYSVEERLLSFGKTLYLYDRRGNELVCLKRNLLSLRPAFRVYIKGVYVAEISKKLFTLRPQYEICGLGWQVTGDIFSHEYKIMDGNRRVAEISKKYFTFGDYYRISISSPLDELMALSAVLAIDAIAELQDRHRN